MQEKWNAWYSKISITFVRITIASISSTSYIQLVMKLVKLTEASNLVDFKCCWKQGSSFLKMRDSTLKYNNGRVLLDIRSLFTDPLFSLKSLSSG